MKPIEFSKNPKNFYVTYSSPTRDYSNIRDEFNHDAIEISKKHGPVYIAFSSGVDSQIIARSFIDKKLDAEFVFLRMKNVNDVEYGQMKECEKFFNIKVRVIEVDLEEYKNQWQEENASNSVNCISQYPFKFLSNSLKENWPIISQGSIEPCLVGSNETNVAMYHNYYESMELRFKLMRDSREIIDFPASAESVASYYTDNNMKTFASTFKYFCKNMLGVEHTQMFNVYAKSFVKGQYYKKDIIWFSKLTGYENGPDWLLQLDYIKDTRVSVPYWELVDFLENTRGQQKTFSSWNFKI
jgi:hypothetical protein